MPIRKTTKKRTTVTKKSRKRKPVEPSKTPVRRSKKVLSQGDGKLAQITLLIIYSILVTLIAYMIWPDDPTVPVTENETVQIENDLSEQVAVPVEENRVLINAPTRVQRTLTCHNPYSYNTENYLLTLVVQPTKVVEGLTWGCGLSIVDEEFEFNVSIMYESEGYMITSNTELPTTEEVDTPELAVEYLSSYSQDTVLRLSDLNDINSLDYISYKGFANCIVTQPLNNRLKMTASGILDDAYLVTSHTHYSELDEVSRYINTGANRFGYGNYLLINDEGHELVSVRY
ncbi:hypothetical protein H6762_00755 [Candidatus Nomurabacteria bacterium]|nr:hypothetical protein [Candidatus Nomurabacteria bacterium]